MLYLITHKYVKMAKHANCKTANAPTRPLWVNNKKVFFFSHVFLTFFTSTFLDRQNRMHESYVTVFLDE